MLGVGVDEIATGDLEGCVRSGLTKFVSSNTGVGA